MMSDSSGVLRNADIINLFNKYLPNPYLVPGTAPGYVTVVVNKTGKVCFLWSLLSSETDKKIRK